MKKLLLLIFVFENASVLSQSLLNGNFEINSAGGCQYNLSNLSFNSYMPDVIAFGNYNNCDILGSACTNYGMPQNGSWFIALSVNTVNGPFDQVALKLNQPLAAGNNYHLTYYYKKDAGYDFDPLLVGYSTDSSSAGTLIDSVQTATTGWAQHSVYFISALPAQYITFNAVPANYGWIHIDNVSISNVTGMQSLADDGSVLVFPKPFNESLSLTSGREIHNGSFSLYDIAGKIVFHNKNLSGNQFHFSTQAVSPGFFFYELKEENVLLSVGKLLKR